MFNFVTAIHVHKAHSESMKNIARRYRTPCPCQSCSKRRLKYQQLKAKLDKSELEAVKRSNADRAVESYKRRKVQQGFFHYYYLISLLFSLQLHAGSDKKAHDKRTSMISFKLYG